MPKKTEYQMKKDLEEARKVMTLYKKGITLREIGRVMGKSHEWVRRRIGLLDKK